MHYLFTLVGLPPSKKNLYKRRSVKLFGGGKRGFGMYIPQEVQSVLDGLLLQIKSQWHNDPLERASVHTKFFVTNEAQDLDNMHQSISDLLKGVVIRDDRIKCVPQISSEAVVVDGVNGYEHTEITVTSL